MPSCHEHDYIEIACLYHIPVRVQLSTGAIFEGKALDCRYDKAGQEVLVLQGQTGEQPLTTQDIQSMQAMVANPHFDVIRFIQTS